MRLPLALRGRIHPIAHDLDNRPQGGRSVRTGYRNLRANLVAFLRGPASKTASQAATNSLRL